MATNGNGIWQKVATTIGAVLIGLLGWFGNVVFGDVSDNTKNIAELDKRMTVIERSQDRIIDGQGEILSELRKLNERGAR